MDVLAFHLRGKMAHFRKYYSNSSALSYWVPPRTTVIGIIAGLLGMERDTYYERFSLQRCQVALALCRQVKKTMQKMNLLMIKSPNDLNGSAEYHSQTATEFIIPMDIVQGFIDYKIWFCHEDEKIQANLIQCLSSDNDCFYRSKGISVALGSAQNLGWIDIDGIYKGTVLHSETEKLHISSIAGVGNLTGLEPVFGSGCSYLKEDLPLEFNGERILTAKDSFIINAAGTGIRGSARELVQLDNGDIIAWMQ